MEFETTIWVPILLAALQVTAILLLSLPSARAWFRPGAPPPSARGV